MIVPAPPDYRASPMDRLREIATCPDDDAEAVAEQKLLDQLDDDE